MKTQFKAIAVAAVAFAMLAADAGARTLYVDASRPNNKGNGLKAKTAKKTLQAAINIAKAGDTILVYSGTYAPISTKNKKIKIKSVSGKAKTTIASTSSTQYSTAIAKLGKEWKETGTYYDSFGNQSTYTWKSDGETKGTSTSLSGFTIDGAASSDLQAGVSGGNVSSCVIKNIGSSKVVCRSKLTACYVQDCSYFGIDRASLNRCKILNNTWSSWSASEASKFSNCLFASNENPILKSCTFANCTVADNTKFAMSKSKAYNTIFFKVAASQFKSSKKNTFSKCYKGASPKFVSTGDYHLAKGSPCINKGTKAASVKKLFGSKDLDGKKRIKGKTVDIGCYEY